MRCRAAIDEALKAREEGKSPTILFNLSGHGHFDMQAYIDYFAGKLVDQDYDAAALEASLAQLPAGGGGVSAAGTAAGDRRRSDAGTRLAEATSPQRG